MMKRFIPLSELKKYHLQHRAQGGPLKDMALFTRARLSVQPLTTGKSGSTMSASVYLVFPFNTSGYSSSSLQRSLNLLRVWRIKHLCEDLDQPPELMLVCFSFVLLKIKSVLITVKPKVSVTQHNSELFYFGISLFNFFFFWDMEE